MAGEAWSKAQVCVLQNSLLAGNTDEEIARLLTRKFPNSPRTVVAIRGKRRCLKLHRQQHLPAKRPSARAIVKPHFTNKEDDVIVVMKEAYPKARWWQIAAAFNFYVESYRRRSGDGIKRRYHTVHQAVIRRRTWMECREEVLRKVSPFFSTLPASIARVQSQSPDQLSELGRQHLFNEKRKSVMEEHPVDYSYDITAERPSPSASITYSAEPQYWTSPIPYYHQSSAYCCSNIDRELSMTDSQFTWMDGWVDCSEDISSTWPFPDNDLSAYYDA